MMFKQARTLPTLVKERAYPKLLEQEDDMDRCYGLKIEAVESNFAAYEKTEMRKTKIKVIARSD